MPATTLVTPPTLDPISLSEAKAHLNVSISEDDGLIAGSIIAARQYVELITRRALMRQTWLATWDGWPVACVNGVRRHRFVLPRPPLVSVTSVGYIDLNGDDQTLTTDQFKSLKLDTGEWAIDPKYGITWPSVRAESASVSVTFVAGYGSSPGDVPEPLRQAMRLLIGHCYENREAVVVGIESSPLALAVDSLVFPYRVFY
jgi:uncharacterized phiE125 gp8 family phage protein